MWIDSHCHLDFPDFQEPEQQGGVQTLIEHAKHNSVSHMLTISTHTARIKTYTGLADQFDNVYTTIGVHPHQAGDEYEKNVTADKLVKMAQSHNKIVAIGECGLDYHYDYVPHDQQKIVLKEHIKACLELDYPIIIHSREADDDMAEILAKEGQGRLKGVLHCFTAGEKLAQKALDLGFYISFSGILTYKRSDELRTICRQIPLDRLLVETDAPYLAPQAYRGKRNEPAYVAHTGRVMAEVHGISETEMAKHTRGNFSELFGVNV